MEYLTFWHKKEPILQCRSLMFSQLLLLLLLPLLHCLVLILLFPIRFLHWFRSVFQSTFYSNLCDCVRILHFYFVCLIFGFCSLYARFSSYFNFFFPFFAKRFFFRLTFFNWYCHVYYWFHNLPFLVYALRYFELLVLVSFDYFRYLCAVDRSS